jgi:hypothetical protein
MSYTESVVRRRAESPKEKTMKTKKTTETVKFAATTYESTLIARIVTRAFDELPQLNRYDRMSLTMDLEACHSNGNPLRLDELLKAKPFDFAHDVVGIINNLDRNTGKLGNCFSPRYSMPKGGR